MDKIKRNQLMGVHKELAFQNEEKKKRAAELVIANKELNFQKEEKKKRASELVIAGKELFFQNREKEKRVAELVIANKEKEKRAAELVIANKELAFQNKEKAKRVAELVIANREKEKKAGELVIANEELVFQNKEKAKRVAELVIANRDKERKAAELVIANEELVFQNKEKAKRVAELVIANREKEKKARELVVANKELVFQNKEKEKRAAELVIANKELAFQNKEKAKRVAELVIANRDKERKAAELVIANEELVFQNKEKEKRAIELIVANKELEKAEEQFRLVVESAPNAMILVNHEGTMTLINCETEKLFGYERKELIGSKLEMLLPKRFRNNHPDHRNTFYASPSVRAMGAGRELFGLKKDSTEIQVEIGLNPIEIAAEQMVLASIIDITERKKQESIIKKQVNELGIKNKELEQFAYIASHDLQEPLRTVSNFIQIIEEDCSGQFNEKAKSHLETINLATKRMSTLVKALLDFSRLGSHKKLVPVSCSKLVNDVIADLQNLIKTMGTTIRIGELPQLNVYEIEMRQLFQNLITNAIKFRKKDIPSEIQIGCKKVGEQWQFFITDNGIGIDPKHFERIFYIFQRLHTDEQYEGYGIGLANCKKIVDQHGGKIWLESVLGSGSTFNFTISNLNL